MGDQQLDIAFTDHFLSSQTLEAFGSFVEQVAAATSDPRVRFWSFIRFVSDQHSDILTAEVPEDWREQVEEVLSSLDLPKIVVEQVEKKGWKFWR